MKKPIFILLATFFICNASYGATIKELLGGKKSLTLSCVIESSMFIDLNEKEHEDTFVGHKYSFKIVGTEANYDGSMGKGDLYVDGSKVTDGKTKILWIYKEFFEFDGDQDDPDSHIKINRVNGAIRISGFPPVGNSYVEIIKNGTCEKVTENKF